MNLRIFEMKRLSISFLCLVFILGCLSACEPGSQSSSSSQNTAPVTETATEPLDIPVSQGNTASLPYVLEDSSHVIPLRGEVQLYVLELGKGAIPKPGSNVIINYHGYLLDGSVFDSSFEKPGVMDFSLAQLIQGWQIGLTEVPSGSKIKLIVPPEMGYGAQDRPGIPGNSILVFDIELLSTY